MRDQRTCKFSSELRAKHQRHVRFFPKIRSLRRPLRFDSGRGEQCTVPKKLTGRSQIVCPLYQNNSTHVACLIGGQTCLAGLFPRLLDQRCVVLGLHRMKPRAHADKCILSWRAQFACELKRIKNPISTTLSSNRRDLRGVTRLSGVQYSLQTLRQHATRPLAGRSTVSYRSSHTYAGVFNVSWCLLRGV